LGGKRSWEATTKTQETNESINRRTTDNTELKLLCVLATKKNQTQREEGRKEGRKVARASERASEQAGEVTNYVYTQQQQHQLPHEKERKKERREGRNSSLQKNTAGTKTKIVFLSANKRPGGMECKRKETPQERKNKNDEDLEEKRRVL